MDSGLLGILIGVVGAGAPALVALLRTVDRAKRAEKALEKFEEKNIATVERIHERIDDLKRDINDMRIDIGRPAPRQERTRKLTGAVLREVDDPSSER